MPEPNGLCWAESVFLSCQAPVCLLVHLSICHVLVRDAGCLLRCEDGAIRLSDPNRRQQLRGGKGLVRSNEYRAEGRPDYHLQVWSSRMHWSPMPAWPREHLSGHRGPSGCHPVSSRHCVSGSWGCAGALPPCLILSRPLWAHLPGLLTREAMAWSPCACWAFLRPESQEKEQMPWSKPATSFMGKHNQNLQPEAGDF